MQESALLERKDLRDRSIERIEVLDKVKKLFLIPGLEMMTTRQVAEYYEVPETIIRQCYIRHKDEIDEDGTKIIKPHDLRGRDIVSQPKLEYRRGGALSIIYGGHEAVIWPAGVKIYSKRAVLRIGMLLRDSPIAREVRTQLLNTFENADNQTRTTDIEEEQRLQSAIGMAVMTGDIQKILEANAAAFSFKNRHIATLEQDKQILTGEILAWTDRASLNKAIRTLASRSGIEFAFIWKKFYDELQYKHGICLKMRGKPPLIQHIREKEWSKAQKSFAALCESLGFTPSTIMQAAKMNSNKSKTNRKSS